MCLGGKATEEDAENVRRLFSAVGRIVQVGPCGTVLSASMCFRFTAHVHGKQ